MGVNLPRSWRNFFGFRISSHGSCIKNWNWLITKQNSKIIWCGRITMHLFQLIRSNDANIWTHRIHNICNCDSSEFGFSKITVIEDKLKIKSKVICYWIDFISISRSLRLIKINDAITWLLSFTNINSTYFVSVKTSRRTWKRQKIFDKDQYLSPITILSSFMFLTGFLKTMNTVSKTWLDF